MGINLKKAVTGAVAGVPGMGPSGNAIGALIGGTDILGGTGSTTTSQVPFETPEQHQARQLLLGYANNGQIGSNFTAGEDLHLAPGDYNMTGLEGQGMSALQRLIASGTPGGFAASDAATRDLMDTSTAGLDKMFSPFSAIADRENLLAEAAAKRSAGAFGNLYSTDTIRNLGDVNAKTAETKQAQLASLTNDALNRKLSAASVAQNSAQGQEAIAQGRIADSFNYGQLERTLANQKADAANAETLRRRNEILGTLNGATAVSGSNVQWGVPSITTPNANPYLDFLNTALQVGGNVAGNYVSGGMAGAARPPQPQQPTQGYVPYNSYNPLSLY